MTVFLTTQYLEEADALADRVGIIDDGKIVAEGTPESLKAEIGAPSVEADAGRPAPGRGRDARPERLRRRRVPPPRAATASPCAWRAARPRWPTWCAPWTRENMEMAHLQLHAPTLDDVFLAKTGRTLEGAGRGRGRPAEAPGRAS